MTTTMTTTATTTTTAIATTTTTATTMEDLNLVLVEEIINKNLKYEKAIFKKKLIIPSIT